MNEAPQTRASRLRSLARRSSPSAAIVFFLMLAVHGLFLAALPGDWRANQSSDFETHYRVAAENLVSGQGYRTSDGQPEVRYPPGFSMMIAAGWTVGDGLGVSRDVSLRAAVAVVTAVGVAVFHLLARSLLPWTTAWIATGLWITYLPFLWLGKQPNSETPYLPLFFGGLWCVVQMVRRVDEGRGFRGFGLAAGVLFGFATLVRPPGLLVAFPVAVAVLWAARRMPGVRRLALAAGLALVLAGQGLVLLPWQLWVVQQTGLIVPVSSGAKVSVLDGLTISVEAGREGPWVPEGVRGLMLDVQANRSSIHGPVSAALFLLDRARDRPLPVLQLLAVKAVRSWYATDSLRFEGLLALLQIPYLILAVWGLGLQGMRPGARSESPVDAPRSADRTADVLVVPLVVCLTLFTWWLTVLVLSILRYMLPAMALLMFPVSDRLLFLTRRIRRRLGSSSAGS